MLSDEKLTHIVHLIFKELKDKGLAAFANEELAIREAKRAGIGYMNKLTSAADTARHRISTQRNPPPEHSPQWETLYRKYLEEELQKK